MIDKRGDIQLKKTDKGIKAERTDWHLKVGKKSWKFFFIVSDIGIEFNHKGDWVYWVWWWKRPSKEKKFFSTSFQAFFKTLTALDLMWDEYWKAEKEARKKEDKKFDEDDDGYGVDIVI